MKIAMPVEQENGMDSSICSHFGQTPYWAVYDSETEELSIHPNTSQHGGGGCQAVAEIASFKPDMVYTLGMGFNAIEKCRAQGIAVKSGSWQTVREVIANLSEVTDMQGGCAGEHGDCH
ncbi:MAG TPA: NifB/NifX family molybdenum-iron cluster-binding protein [bacterium]|nr:NifB/NifX family molybdenum-iron cluster-binding protein [bacterium]